MSSLSSSTSTLASVERRPEAEPLPSKVGEIGYIAPKSPEIRQSSTTSAPPSPLPARHPADRPNEPAPDVASQTPSITETVPVQSTTGTSSGKKSWFRRLSLGGISILSIIRILLLLAFMGATGAAWGLTITRFGVPQSAEEAAGDMPPSSADNNNNNDNGGWGPPAFSSIVIVHVSFTIVTLVQLVFLERSIFHARAERYMYKHGMAPGEAGTSMAIAPWNRPPLPTYAAALTESGVGTGDVEDNLIAIPPPPAYGNTRGSKLLLAGMLRESLIRQLNRSSQQSRISEVSRAPPTPREMEEGPKSRPLSYDASEEIDNAKRALDLEVALAKLENTRE
ncbi:hypothetical protein M408DRAFT_326286 [Serendipita vermifera MAFF 305830]|uniref:Uncharacterized protein n=1 Tax=Serendipita vermifera MAFF 305830 TaxID=933852 RepID=A0A0C2X6D1_SERVB|nr:hypothetical protein M408DRAFT_326286 [Serendipita vermifera MAFF 305830]